MFEWRKTSVNTTIPRYLIYNINNEFIINGLQLKLCDRSDIMASDIYRFVFISRYKNTKIILTFEYV